MSLKRTKTLEEALTGFPPVFRIGGVPGSGSGSFPQLQPTVLGPDDDRRGVGLPSERDQEFVSY